MKILYRNVETEEVLIVNPDPAPNPDPDPVPFPTEPE